MKRCLLFCGFAGLTCALTAWATGLEGANQSGGKPKRAPSADVIQIAPDSGSCRVLLIDRRQLASDIPGVISFVGPREGDSVKSGELVARLRDEVAAAELAVAERKASSELAIQYAERAREFSDVDYERQLDLFKKTAASKFDVERARVVAARSAIEVDQARVQKEVDGLSRDLAAARLAMYRIEAPADGHWVVTSVYRYPGEAVRQGDPILEIVSTDRVRVQGFIRRVDQAVRVQPGARVEVQIANLDPQNELGRRVFEGRIVFVDPTVSSSAGVRVWAELPNPDGALREGLDAFMTIFPNEVVEMQKTANADR